MAYRKIWKSKKKARKHYKRKGKISYPDRHNWVMEGKASVLYNSAPGTPLGTGSVAIGKVIGQRPNFVQFGGAINFALNQTINATQFLAPNFDRYKINKIKIRVIPENNFSNVNGAGTLATMKVVYDYDDAMVPTVGDVESRRGKTYRLDKPFTINLTPKIAFPLYSGPVGNQDQAYGQMKAGWMNLAQPWTPVYGVKFMVRDWFALSTTPVNDLQVRFQIQYFVSAKEQLSINRAPSLVEEYDPPTTEIVDLSQNEIEACNLPTRP